MILKCTLNVLNNTLLHKIDYFMLALQTCFAIYSSKEQMSNVIIRAAIQIHKTVKMTNTVRNKINKSLSIIINLDIKLESLT